MNDINLYENISELENKFPIKIQKYKAQFFTPHWHEHIELLYVINGNGKFSCNNQQLIATKGETVIVNSNELHSMAAENEIEYICVIINPSVFHDIKYENIILESKISKNTTLTRLFKNLYDEHTNHDICSDISIKGNTYLLMSYLIRNYTAMQLSPSAYDILISKIKTVNTILDYIHQNYNKPITTSDLANKCFLNESYICRMFKKATGTTIINYLNQFRINKAAILLKNTNENISFIAESVGFDSLNYFDRTFKKYKKISPKEYRIQ